MPSALTYPGVYVEELQSPVRTITPVATSITAFIGSAPRGGDATRPTRVTSFADYSRQFGGLDPTSSMSYAVSQYFQNGGSDALIVRVTGAGSQPAVVSAGGVPLQAASAGIWGNNIRVRVDLLTKDATLPNPTLFNLFVYDTVSKTLEEYRNVSTDPDNERSIKQILADLSSLVEIPDGVALSGRPSASSDPPAGSNWFDDGSGAFAQASSGQDGAPVSDLEIVGDQASKTGLYSLENADLFNILCIPPIDFISDISPDTYAKALQYCVGRRAMLFIDAPSGWTSVSQAVNGMPQLISALGGVDQTKNAAVFFPRLRMPDEKKRNRLGTFVPCGALAGICARTDVSRGVWKAPAGIEAGISGAQDFTVKMTDLENGLLNPKGINCLRNFRAYGNVVWGSRTMAGDDAMASEWKYLPVRRFALFLEESLYRGTQWVVFEPNDEPLWSRIRLNVGVFMRDLFRKGALQGQTPKEAYFVNCDSTTTTQSDINRGIVNIEVGFAPLKPAEFVVLKFQQMAGKLDT